MTTGGGSAWRNENIMGVLIAFIREIRWLNSYIDGWVLKSSQTTLPLGWEMLAKVLTNSLNCIDHENADEIERHRLRAETTDRDSTSLNYVACLMFSRVGDSYWRGGCWIWHAFRSVTASAPLVSLWSIIAAWGSASRAERVEARLGLLQQEDVELFGRSAKLLEYLKSDLEMRLLPLETREEQAGHSIWNIEECWIKWVIQ
jgi:hypothetical protein